MAWRAYEKVAGSEAAHRELDRLVCSLRANSVSPYYPEGLGDVRRTVAAATACRAVLQAVHAADAERMAGDAGVPVLDVRLTSSDCGRPYAHVAEGTFASPCADTLPPASATAAFQLVTPTAWTDARSGALGGPVAVLLPGTGEQGFRRRRQLVAYPLAEAGIASVIFEGPYYGSRRPATMYGSKLRSLSDLPVDRKSVV